jgi:NAD(P)H-hydrate repair Nnr-like enzyme with NAD(P)H-hydrate epimerase domain
MEPKKESEKTTIVVSIPIKKKLNSLKSNLEIKTFDILIDGLIGVVQKFKMREELKTIMKGS